MAPREQVSAAELGAAARDGTFECLAVRLPVLSGHLPRRPRRRRAPRRIEVVVLARRHRTPLSLLLRLALGLIDHRERGVDLQASGHAAERRAGRLLPL